MSLHLDNADRKAPAAYNEFEEIVISRHIDRGQGSTYRINGREVRARDVQLLFADLSTGAHSTAIVGQGRISALIGAKPTERRMLLEEAAGIRGLHSRRHEAELRLKGAEPTWSAWTTCRRPGRPVPGLQRQARQRPIAGFPATADPGGHPAAPHWIEARPAWKPPVSGWTRRNAWSPAHRGRRAAMKTDKTTVLPDCARTSQAAELQRLLVAQRELENEEAGRKGPGRDAERLDQISGDSAASGALPATPPRRWAAGSWIGEIAAAREGKAEAIEAARTAYAAVGAEVEDREGRLRP